ncbi:hypothetical protein E4U21_003402 [Claviceps maximensis]|nr:hypothetical protein E4U21_003402 [Claviceps maximensis]
MAFNSSFGSQPDALVQEIQNVERITGVVPGEYHQGTTNIRTPPLKASHNIL